MLGQFPPLCNAESAYEFGYATLIIAGSQRRIEIPGTPPTQHLETLKLLISRGLPPDVPDIGEYTALHHVIPGQSFRDREELIRTLVTSGANVNFQNRWGDTPLHHQSHPDAQSKQP
jgi:ankyrin repeat protein